MSLIGETHSGWLGQFPNNASTLFDSNVPPTPTWTHDLLLSFRREEDELTRMQVVGADLSFCLHGNCAVMSLRYDSKVGLQWMLYLPQAIPVHSSVWRRASRIKQKLSACMPSTCA